MGGASSSEARSHSGLLCVRLRIMNRDRPAGFSSTATAKAARAMARARQIRVLVTTTAFTQRALVMTGANFCDAVHGGLRLHGLSNGHVCYNEFTHNMK